jgi:hypothetical protein
MVLYPMQIMETDELGWNVLTSAEQAYVKSMYHQLFQIRTTEPLRFMLKNEDVVVSMALPTADHARLIHTPLSEVRTWLEECVEASAMEVEVKKYKFWQKKWTKRRGHWHVFNGQFKCSFRDHINARVVVTTI